ncbi:VOC family protein [Lacticaseibacillus suihuaensis]
MNRINLICLGVRDMAKALSFYKGLGFKTDEKGTNPPVVFFDTQGTKFELFPLTNLANDIAPGVGVPLSAGGFPGFTLAINGKNKAEVDGVLARASQLGAKIVKPAQQALDWDGYSGYFQDLDGYYWEVAYGPSWEFDDNDMLIVSKNA